MDGVYFKLISTFRGDGAGDYWDLQERQLQTIDKWEYPASF